MAAAYRHEELQKTPAGYRVRSVKRGSHVVRIAFPPGPRKKGSGKVVEILHPNGENNPSCIVSNQARKNPGELLIFGNPSTKRATRERAERIRGARLNPDYVYFTMNGRQYRTDGQIVEGKDGQTWNRTGSLPVVLAARKEWAARSGNPKAFAGWSRFTGKEKNFLRSIHMPAPKNEEEVRAYKETLKKIDEINARHRGENPTRMQVTFDRGIQKYLAFLYDPKFGNLYGTGFTKKQAVKALHEVVRTARRTGSWRNPRRRNQPFVCKRCGKEFTAAQVEAGEYRKHLAEHRAKRSTARRRRTDRNPDETKQAVKLFQSFHGKDPKDIAEKHVSAAIRKDYAALGDLEYLVVVTPLGQSAKFDFEGDGVKLASSPDGRQLYCIGGNQNLAQCLTADSLEKDFVNLGEATEVQYLARKVHGNFEPVSYFHKFGEKTGARPQLAYDKLKRQIFFIGGEYFIETKKGVSPGIEN